MSESNDTQCTLEGDLLSKGKCFTICDGVLEVILKHPTPPAHQKVQSHSTCGCVLTSQQCIQEMAEKEEKRKELKKRKRRKGENVRKRRRKRKKKKRKMRKKEKRKKTKEGGKGINEERYVSKHDNVAWHLKINNVTLLLLSTGNK